MLQQDQKKISTNYIILLQWESVFYVGFVYLAVFFRQQSHLFNEAKALCKCVDGKREILSPAILLILSGIGFFERALKKNRDYWHSICQSINFEERKISKGIQYMIQMNIAH